MKNKMDSIKIQKQRHIQFCLLLLIACVLLFSSIIVYLLCIGSVGWEFNFTYTIVFVSAVGGSILLPMIIFLILRALNKNYYVISHDGIKLFNSDKEIFTISNISILRLGYLGFQYALLMQMGAGYLSVQYTEASGQIKPTMTFPDGGALLGIDMTAKQALQVAQILGKDLQH